MICVKSFVFFSYSMSVFASRHFLQFFYLSWAVITNACIPIPAVIAFEVFVKLCKFYYVYNVQCQVAGTGEAERYALGPDGTFVIDIAINSLIVLRVTIMFMELTMKIPVDCKAIFAAIDPLY